MKEILDAIETPYVDAQTLLAHLKDYQKPRDWIANMVKKGALLRLKNGFFLITSRFIRGKVDYPYEQIANLLYGPSYVSLEWALSFYNLIPERVSMITSVTTGSNRDYSTPIGHFTYRHLSSSRYSVGFAHKEIMGQMGGFLIATPEKALVDWVYFTCKNMNQSELLEDLLEGKRIEKGDLKHLRKNLIETIAKQYKSKIIKELSKIIKLL